MEKRMYNKEGAVRLLIVFVLVTLFFMGGFTAPWSYILLAVAGILY